MRKVDDCQRCGREFNVRPNRTLCSRCRSQRTKAETNAQRAAVARDGKCVECGSVDSLHGHHVLTRKDRPDLATDLSNIIALCAPCHAAKHPEGRLFKRIERKGIAQ